MITDLVLNVFGVAGGWLADALPAAGAPSLPGASSVSGVIGQLDSLIPIAGLLQVAAAVLASVLAFFALRLLLLVRYVVLP